MRSYRLTSVWGIPIRINISLILFLPILAWLIGSGQQIALYAGIIDRLAGSTLDVAVLRQGATPWLIGAAAAIGLFVSVTIHELGHSWVALRYGLTIESIMTLDSRTISATSTAAEFVDQMVVNRRTEFGVTDETGATVGIVSLQHLKDVDQRTGATTLVADVMAEEPLTVQATADAFDALVELGTTKASYALVEEDGAIVGILSQADYASALELRRAIGTVSEGDQSLPMTGPVTYLPPGGSVDMSSNFITTATTFSGFSNFLGLAQVVLL